ncbi:MAG: hypothetical protein B6230_06475 [Desulfobacteraceae bacterium 4572_89]|nr:MAG: hypothetical protein B6230_06475 [Desulfobacteraceae bacterium 4572_89]
MNTEAVVDYILSTGWDDFPGIVQHQSKRCLLDALGAMIVGTQTPVYEIMHQYVSIQMGTGPAALMNSVLKSSTTGAALANGFAANALDIDDGCRLAKGHPGSSVLPVVLAASQGAHSCDGKQFLTALILGYETAIRAAYIRHAVYSVYHSSGSWGGIGSAAAAGKLLKLNENELFNALGVSTYHVPLAPMMIGIETPSMVKDSIGWGAFVGMSSVEMARSGFTGPRSIFDESPNEEWISSLGHTFEIMNLFFKPYAACRWAQPGVDGVLKIMGQENLTIKNIGRIRIYTFSEAAALSREYPRNTEDAQYNFSYPIAAAVIHGKVGPKQMLPPVIFDETLHQIMDKIEVFVEDRFQKEFPAKTLADIEIEDIHGNCIRSGVMSARWDLSNTLPTDKELKEKFLWLVSPVLGNDKARLLIELIFKLDQCESIDPLMDLCKGNTEECKR